MEIRTPPPLTINTCRLLLLKNDEWVTWNIPNSDPIEILIVRKDSIQCLPMSMKEMFDITGCSGDALASLISSASKIIATNP
jgi:hypothetical protein